MKRRLLVLVAVLAAATMVLTSCGGPKLGPILSSEKIAQLIEAKNPEKLPESAKNRKDTLIVGTTAPEGKFNPIYSASVYDSWVVDLVMEGLITNNDKGEAVPQIAEKWEVSEDGKTYTFTLHKGIKFTNGEELTAEDVAFTFTAICDPKYDGPRTDAVSDLLGFEEYRKGNATSVEGIKVINKHKISFTLKDIKAPAIYDFSYGIMCKKYYGFEKGNIDKLKELLGKPIGAGPYKFVEHKPGQEVRFEKNEKYWKGEPKIAKIIMKVTNADTVIQELSTGGVDIDRVAAKPENVQLLTTAGFLNLQVYPANQYGYMGWNMRLPKFADKRVRQALTYGFNRKGFVDSYYQGYADVCNAPVSPVSWAYTEDVNKYEYNLAKAEELMDAAGWIKAADGYRYKDGEKFTIKWSTYIGSKYVESLTGYLIQDWGKLGVEVVPELFEFGALGDKVYDNQDFELYNMAWSLSIDPDPIGIFGKDQLEKGGYNSVGWDNAQSFELMEKGIRETNQEKRKEIYKDWVKLASEELPYMFLNQGKDMYALSCRVKNVAFGAYFNWTYDIHLAELVSEAK